MRAQLLVATTLASGLILLGVACGTETVYVYEDAGPGAAASSSSSSGKSSSGGKTSSSSSSSGDDDDDTTSSSSSSGGSSSSSGGSSSSSSGGSSSGFTVMPSTTLVEGDDVVLLQIVGDDALYRKFPAAAGDPSEIYAIPIAGGTPTKLWDLGPTDGQAISGVVVARWTGITNGLGNLEVWTRASGVKTGIATSSVAGLIRGSADGSRIAFSQEATLAGNQPNSTAIGVRGINDATNIVTLNGAAGQVNLASSKCAPQLSFVGQTFFAEFCNGTVASQNLARLVALPAGSTTLVRIDAADLASANTLAGGVRFSNDAAGTKIVAASLGGSNNTGRVYTVAHPTTGIVDLEAFPNTLGGLLYTMTPDGSSVFYRMAPDAASNGTLKLANVTAAPAVVKTISDDVRAVTGFSADGHGLAFSKIPRDGSTGLVDVVFADLTAATITPTPLLADAKGLPIGFTGNSARLVFLDGTSLPASPPVINSVPLAGGTPTPVVTTGAPVGGRVAPTGTGLVFFTNMKPAKAATATTPAMPQMADINYVDAVTPAAPKKISSGVPLDSKDTELFLSGKKVVYTRLEPAAQAGIYSVTLP